MSRNALVSVENPGGIPALLGAGDSPVFSSGITLDAASTGASVDFLANLPVWSLSRASFSPTSLMAAFRPSRMETGLSDARSAGASRPITPLSTAPISADSAVWVSANSSACSYLYSPVKFNARCSGGR